MPGVGLKLFNMTNEQKLIAALDGLLSVMNLDEDGGWFICAEAAPEIKASLQVLEEVGQPFDGNFDFITENENV